MGSDGISFWVPFPVEHERPTHMKAEPLTTVEIEPERPARAAVIWLHGLGADGHDFVPIVPLLGLEKNAVRFVFPHAPMMPVQLNMGMVMRAWYDIASLDEHAIDRPGLDRSVGAIRDLVRRENERGIPTERILLAGFSQGGSVALRAALTSVTPFLGVVALSTYFINIPVTDAARGLRIFQAHGTYDPVVAYAWGVRSRDRLQELGCEVTWRDYPMEHAVCPEEIEDLAGWLAAVLEDSESTGAR